jgi:H+/Cl- antiporter ClcA
MTEPLAHAINHFIGDDGEWTRELIDNYDVIDDQGPDGEVPMQPAFAQDRGFWEILVCAIFMGAFTGLVALGFMNVIDEVPKRWVDNGDFDSAADCGYYDGKPEWIIIVGTAGFLVGTLRWALKFPNDLPGFFKEVTSCHVDYTHAPQTLLLSAISIAGGASLGPEQAMGNVGGGLATLIAEKLEFEEEHSKLTVLTGMAAAMGGIFPSPVLGVLMIHELGNPPKSFMESTLLMSIGAISSFLVFYMLEDYTYLEPLKANYQLSMNWEFETKHCGVAIVIGALSSVIALMTLLIVGITKQVFYRIEERCNKVGLPGKIIVCTIGGLCIGNTYIFDI